MELWRYICSVLMASLWAWAVATWLPSGAGWKALLIGVGAVLIGWLWSKP
jgi:hypothetical protein